MKVLEFCNGFHLTIKKTSLYTVSLQLALMGFIETRG